MNVCTAPSRLASRIVLQRPRHAVACPSFRFRFKLFASVTRASLVRYAWLSIAAAVFGLLTKGGAWLATGSLGLLSDAMESLVNLAAALMAWAMLAIAARPADDDHAFGHEKAEYFSSGAEGGLMLVAGISIAYAAIQRFRYPQPIEQIELGIAIAVTASIVNLVVSRILLRAGQRHRSITLEADARHLLTDVWTSAGILLALAAVAVTGWHVLDPIIAIVVAAMILWSGARLIQRSIHGLMDAALPRDEQRAVQDTLDRYCKDEGIQYHALRTRCAAARSFVEVHVLVPGAWSVQRGHNLLEAIEADIRGKLANATITTHLEPMEDPVSWQDTGLDRDELAKSEPERDELAGKGPERDEPRRMRGA